MTLRGKAEQCLWEIEHRDLEMTLEIKGMQYT